MAEATTIQNNEDVKSSGKTPPILPTIYVGRPFKSGIFINRITVDEKAVDASKSQIRISAGVRVQIFGQNLSSFDSVALRIGGITYTPLNTEHYSSEIRFNIPNYDSDILSGGGIIALELLSFFHPELSAKLNNYFLYRTEKQVEENTKEDNNKGARSQANAEETNNSQSTGVAAGVVGAAGSQTTGQVGAAAIGASATVVTGAAAVNLENDIDSDTEAEVEESVETGGTLSSSNAEVTSGGQSATQSVTGEVSGDTDISSSGTAQTSGSVQTAGEVSAGGTVSAAASANASVNANASVTAGVKGQAAVSGTAAQNVSGEVGAGTAATGAGSINAQVQGSANVSETGQIQGKAASNGSAAADSQAVQGTAKAPVSAVGGSASHGGGSGQSAKANFSGQSSADVKQGGGTQEPQPSQSPSSDAAATQPSGANISADSNPNLNSKSSQPDTQANNTALESKAGIDKNRGVSKTPGNIDGVKSNAPVGLQNILKNDALRENLGVGAVEKPLGEALANHQKSGQGRKNIGQDGGENQSGLSERGQGDTQVPSPLDQATGMPNVAPENAERDAQTSEQGDKDQQGKAEQPSKDTPGQEKSDADNKSNALPSGDEPEQEDDANPENQAAEDDIQADPQKPGVKSFDNAEAEQIANKAVNTYLKGVAAVVWASALPTFGFTLLLGALGGDLLWLLKNKVVEIVIKNNPLLAKIPNVDVKKLKIEFSTTVKANIVAMNAAVILIICAILIFCVAIVWALCKNWYTYPIRKIAGMDEICKMVDQSAVGSALNSTTSGGFQASNNTPGSLASTAKWTAQINTYAQKYNIDACILRVVVQKESGGNDQAIGCDCAYNKNATCPDKRKTYSSDYQFNWAQCSYGIGITQWTIYPKGGSGYKAWQNSSVPSRSILNSWYGINDLLDANTSLDLTAHQFSTWLSQNNGDVSAAFGSYVGSSSSQASFVADRMALYNLCKESGQ